MYSFERLRDIDALELFLGILPGERYPRVKESYCPDSDSNNKGEVIGYLTFDPQTGDIRFSENSLEESVSH